jgi:hypothetical protein
MGRGIGARSRGNGNNSYMGSILIGVKLRGKPVPIGSLKPGGKHGEVKIIKPAVRDKNGARLTPPHAI